MDKNMNLSTRTQVLEKLRRRSENAGAEHERQLIDQAVQLLGYHRKAAIRAFLNPSNMIAFSDSAAKFPGEKNPPLD